MTVYVVRHAWAEERDDAVYPNDDVRPLARKGRKRFRRLARRLCRRGFDAAHIATSPLVRCRQTADILAEYAAGEPLITELDALRPGSQLQPLLDWTRQQEGRDVAWVGHAPDVDQLTAALVGDGRAVIRFDKGAVAAIRFDGPPAAGQGTLCWLAVAELLKC
ncbi:MAG TPA: histidine phosphatase family protein [Pirellulales bacterium]|jgi:phosphohistidine phosphatase|nr:histidine phosphatase family protein [Pirellulales bacterium]